jgi:hypothetical protein
VNDLSARRIPGIQTSIDRFLGPSLTLADHSSKITTPTVPSEFSVLYTGEDCLIERHQLNVMWAWLIGKASVMGDVRVWVNTESGVYHCPGTQCYGHAKAGAFMTQDEAQRGGYRAAAGRVCQCGQ